MYSQDVVILFFGTMILHLLGYVFFPYVLILNYHLIELKNENKIVEAQSTNAGITSDRSIFTSRKIIGVRRVLGSPSEVREDPNQ